MQLTDIATVVVWGTSPMPLCFQRNLMTFVKAHPAQMIFITTSHNNNITAAIAVTVHVCSSQLVIVTYALTYQLLLIAHLTVFIDTLPTYIEAFKIASEIESDAILINFENIDICSLS